MGVDICGTCHSPRVKAVPTNDTEHYPNGVMWVCPDCRTVSALHGYDFNAQAQQPASSPSPSPAYQPTPQVNPTSYQTSKRPGAVVFGVITIVVSVISIFVLFFGNGLNITAISCLGSLFALFGVFAGTMLVAGRKPIGKTLVIVYWLIVLVSTVIALLVGR